MHAAQEDVPHYNNTERQVIGVLLMNPEKVLSEHIEARWFERHYRVIEAMIALAGKGITIDVFTVSKEMGGKGLSSLIEIQKDSWASEKNYSMYLAKIKIDFEARVIVSSVKKALVELETGAKPSAVITSLIADSIKVSTAEGKNYTYTAREAMTVFVDRLAEIYEAKDGDSLGLKTGIAGLDDVLGDMQPSDMMIVGARPGVGKTAFALSVLRNIAKTGKRVGFFSTEMSVFQVMGRLTSLESGLLASKLRKADLDDEDWPRLTAATQVIQGLGFRVCDKPAITVGEILMQARAWAADGGIDFIAVDYLTRIQPDKPRENQTINIGEIATSLKNLARILNIPILVLAQLNRGSEKRADRTPVMADLRDSGVIEQEADQILMLYRPDDGGAEVIVEKNRHGECGVVRCLFEPSTMHWKQFESNYN